MPGGRPVGSINTQRPFADALRMELAAAGDNHRVLRAIARNLIELAVGNGPNALAAIREISDRLDGKARQATDITVHNADARNLTDDELATIVGTEPQDTEQDPKPDPTKLN